METRIDNPGYKNTRQDRGCKIAIDSLISQLRIYRQPRNQLACLALNRNGGWRQLHIERLVLRGSSASPPTSQFRSTGGKGMQPPLFLGDWTKERLAMICNVVMNDVGPNLDLDLDFVGDKQPFLPR